MVLTGFSGYWQILSMYELYGFRTGKKFAFGTFGSATFLHPSSFSHLWWVFRTLGGEFVSGFALGCSEPVMFQEQINRPKSVILTFPFTVSLTSSRRFYIETHHIKKIIPCASGVCPGLADWKYSAKLVKLCQIFQS